MYSSVTYIYHVVNYIIDLITGRLHLLTIFT